MSTWIRNPWIEPMKLKRLSDIRRKELRQAAFAVLEREGIAGATLEKVAAQAGTHITLEGQEMDVTTTGLARMNMTILLPRLAGSRALPARVSRPARGWSPYAGSKYYRNQSSSQEQIG